jgi:hypothetical protein
MPHDTAPGPLWEQEIVGSNPIIPILSAYKATYS